MVSNEFVGNTSLEECEGMKESINGMPISEIIKIWKTLQSNKSMPLYKMNIPTYPLVRSYKPELTGILGSNERAQAMRKSSNTENLHTTDQVRVFGKMSPELKSIYQSKDVIVFVGPGNGRNEVERLKDVFNCRTPEDSTGEINLKQLKEMNFFKDKVVILRDINQSVNEAAAAYIGARTGIKVTHTTGDFRNANMLHSVIRYGRIGFVSLGYTMGNYEIEEIKERIDMLRPDLHPQYGEKCVHLYFTMNTDINIEQSMATYEASVEDASFLTGGFASTMTHEKGHIQGSFKWEDCIRAIHGYHRKVKEGQYIHHGRVLGGVEILDNETTKDGITISFRDGEQGEQFSFTLQPGEKYFFLQSKRPDQEYFTSLTPPNEDFEMQLQTVETVTACSMRLPTKAKQEDIVEHKRNMHKWIKNKTIYDLSLLLKGVGLALLAWCIAQYVISRDEGDQSADYKNAIIEKKAAQLYHVMKLDIATLLRDSLTSELSTESNLEELMYPSIQAVQKEYVQKMTISMRTVINEIYDLDSLKMMDIHNKDLEGQVVDLLRSHIIEDDESAASLTIGSEKLRKLLCNVTINPGARQQGPFPKDEIMYGQELIQFIYDFYETPFIENYLEARGIKLVKRDVRS